MSEVATNRPDASPLEWPGVRTTPAPPISLTDVLPEMAGLQAVTVRLHPRRGLAPDLAASKLGGMFLWGEDEPWPVCADRDVHDDPVPLVPVVQLRAEDFPEIPFPESRSLLQVFWCPVEHGEAWSVRTTVIWRKAVPVFRPRLQAPQPRDALEWFLPRPGVLYPERVIEYPNFVDLSDAQQRALEHWDVAPLAKALGDDCLDGPSVYRDLLSVCPGSKVSGYARRRAGDSIAPACDRCRRVMDHLLTLIDDELAVGAVRWCPIEDRQALVQPPRCGSEPPFDLGFDFGGGSLQLFVCRRCPGWPVKQLVRPN